MNSRERFQNLLQQLNEQPAKEKETAAEIERIFGCKNAVLLLDISGFCRRSSDEKSETAPAFKENPNAPFSHPYFWSPFILFGNWK